MLQLQLLQVKRSCCSETNAYVGTHHNPLQIGFFNLAALGTERGLHSEPAVMRIPM